MMMKERLWQYAVLKHPTAEDRESGERTEILVPPSDYIVASNVEEVTLIACHKIPPEELAHADRLEVAVRPF